MLMPSTTQRSEAGFSLIELLVAMLLVGVVGSVVFSSSIQALQIQSDTTARLDAMHELEGAVQRASRDLRAANPLQISTTEDAETYIAADVYRGNEKLRVVYELVEIGDDRALAQSVSRDGAVISQRDLVTLVRDDTTAIFRYLDAEGELIRCDDGPATCASEFGQAYSVAIRLERLVRDQDPVVVETVINIRNVRYGGST